MPNDLKPLLQHIQWETISSPDEAIELWLIGHAQHEELCMPSIMCANLDQRCPQFTSIYLRQALINMKRAGLVMETISAGDVGPYSYLVWTGDAWDHKPEDALARPDYVATPECDTLTVHITPPEPAPHAYVVMHGSPVKGFSIHGTWASAYDAGDWADQNLAREYDYWVMPLVHAYP